ncbi:Acyl-homoserine lactone acylase PvdQ [Ralstonia condita]|uniref:Acyl-homoserine lactone acylase PvdQ n=1 Tax=Ralstonia condita TaxID=3058600 RepID=A0ABM9IWT4_9RALS|nr:acylase [Ralstonia sp. LMG 7141]CAJ0774739.1 Acyl-homoserine lactone acylase PvdQ [Ralstonia sp. LMG 7141]
MTPRFALRSTFALAALAALAGCAGTTGGNWATPSDTGLSADIRRTAFGIPHIRANDYASLGFGMAYAYAQDNVCLLADQVVTVNGERSKIFGADGTVTVSFKPIPNTQSDAFFKGISDEAGLRAGYAQMSPEARELLRGYIAGYNRYLKDTPPANYPSACRNANWVRPLTLSDMMLMGEEKAIQASAGAMLASIVAARPPGGAAVSSLATPPTAVDTAALDRDLQLRDMPIGSNGWAFGKSVTDNGRGVLLGNPHFPWTGTNRFYQVHLTVPGKLDVMGASIAAFPVVSIGFNKDVAWTHTVSTGRRFTLFELKLAEGDPTTYLIDGTPHKMTTRTVAFDVKLPDGRIERRTHTFYDTVYGPVLSMPAGGMPWTTQKAYTLRDANRNNTRSIDTWLHIAQARDVAGIRQAIGNLGIPWVNTIATDRNGRALFADVSTTPDVSAEMLRRCAPSPLADKLFKGVGLVLLDGSRSTCNWQVDPASPVPGLVAPAHMPVLERDDFVANSNDSSWLTNPAQKLTGFSPVMGATEVPQRLRTRIGLIEIGRRLAGSDGLSGNRINLPNLQAMLFRDANLAGHLVGDDLLAACKRSLNLDAETRDGCAALSLWNRTSDADARAAHLFREFWMRAKDIPHVYAVDFNAADPIYTPRGLRMNDAAVRSAVFKALKDAVHAVRAAGFALDAPLGTVQAARAPGGPIPLHGGEEYEGVLNKLQSLPIGPKGLAVYYGSSYIQTVTFDDQGPVADAILTYGESSDPASPHAFDQMRMFSSKHWNRLPFSEAAIAADPALKVTRLSQ